MARANSTKTASRTDNTLKAETHGPENHQAIAAGLNYSDAQTALELALAQLQAPDLPVEQMTELYARAQAFAARCEQLLETVEQSIELWDPQERKTSPLEEM